MRKSSAGEARRVFWLSACSVFVAVWAHETAAAPLGVGYRETYELAVPEAATSNLSERLMISEGSLNKTGAGTLAFAVSNLSLQAGGAIAVRDGTLRVEQGTDTVAAPAPCPLDVLALAAFWVDATTNVVTVSSNGNTYADAWLDAREPDTEAPYAYPRAVASFSKTNCAPQVLSNAGPSETLPSIWFGRYASLRWMLWTTPAGGTADISGICHVFAVHGVFQSYGYIFGAMPGGNPDFHISDFSGGSTSAVLWHPAEFSTTALRQGRTYLNGERVDGTLVKPNIGWQLLEVASGARTLHNANFFNDRNIDFSGKRLGGDYLCEVAVFTNRLSETDRLRVQSYLMQKWRGAKALAPLAATVSAAGTVVADVSANSELTLRLNGDGALQKQGEGKAVLDDTSAVTNLFRSVSVQAGTLDVRLPVPLALEAGSRVTASNTVICIAQDAGAGQIVKEGTGTVTVTSLPANLERLAVSAGVLVLAAPPVATSVATVVSGSVPNATFEAELLTTYRRGIANGETYFGWTASFPAPTGSADNAVFVFNRKVASTNVNLNWACPYDAPEGQQVLALKQDASVSTTLTLPVAGIYDLSFYSSARTILVNRHEFDLCIVDGQVTNRVSPVQTFNLPYARQNFRLPWLEAGNHTLLFHRTLMGVDTLGTIDDLKVTLVSTTGPGIGAFFNGDFEQSYPNNPTAFTTSNLASGWAFTATTNNLTTSGITLPASSVYFYNPSTAYGSVMLGIYSNGVASTTLALPAGTYKLQGDLCNWPCNLHNYQVGGTHQVTATVTRASSEKVVLGMVTTSASMLTPTAWPTAFTVTNNETVTLSLAGSPQKAAMLIDNLVLVPHASPIVQNGSFEASANWTFVYNTAIQPKDNATYNNLSQSNDYGVAIYDGTRRLLLVQTGLAYQDIQLPAPGLYRLVFHAAQRCPLTYGNTYGHNPVRAWLAQGGATNVIGWTRVDDNPLVRREFLFQVAGAGTYRFGLQGMTDNSPEYPGSDQNALIDGVSIEPATDLGAAGFALPRSLALTVSRGARLQLSYVGTQTVDSVSYAGKLLAGLINQPSHPELVSGPGALYAHPKGSVLFIR